MSARRRYIVSYDIRENRRLRRVHQVVKEYGYAFQYSVYICDLTKSELLDLRWALRDEMHEGVDSVAFIDLGDPNGRGADCIEFMGLPSTVPIDGSATIV